MKASVIIPTYNGRDRIGRTLDALGAQSMKEFETIVVIDGSSDDTLVVLKSRKDYDMLRIVEQENQGRAGSRNSGAALAIGQILAFCDDDMRPNPEWVERHLAHHDHHHDSVLVGGQMEDYNEMGSDIQRYKAHLSRKWTALVHTEENGTMKAPFITAANFSISKSLFEKLGGFDDAFTDAEDRDLAIRCKKQNISIYFDPLNVGWHLDRITAKRYSNRLKEYHKATEQLKQKHPGYFETLKEGPPNGLKKMVYLFCSLNLWIWIIDHFNLLRVVPRKLRYRFYDFCFTGVFIRSGS